MKPTYCPICQQELPLDAKDADYAPFCSERCQMVDLGLWLTESYVAKSTFRQSEQLPSQDETL